MKRHVFLNCLVVFFVICILSPLVSYAGDKLVTTMSAKTYYDVAVKGSIGVKADNIPNKEYVDNANIVTLTEATSLTALTHGGKTILLSLLAGFTAILPEATGSGVQFKIKVGIVNTSNSYIIAALTTDTMSGFVYMIDGDDNSVSGFLVDGTDDKLTLNATTTGGLTIGDTIILTDAQDGVWHIEAILTGSGTIATPAAATS